MGKDRGFGRQPEPHCGIYGSVLYISYHYKANRNVAYACNYHVVWCPKYRRPVLVEGVDAWLKEIVSHVIATCRADLMAVEVMPDHVHLLVEVDPQFGIHRLVKLMKGRSSRLLRQEFAWLRSRLPTLWTNSYFVATALRQAQGGAPLDIVKRYIEAQKGV